MHYFQGLVKYTIFTVLLLYLWLPCLQWYIACRSTAHIPSLDQSVLIYNLLYRYGLAKVVPDKYISLTVPVPFGPLDSISPASVPYPPFEIVFLVQSDFTRCTSGLWYPAHIGAKTVWKTWRAQWECGGLPMYLVALTWKKASFLDFSGCVPPADTSIP